MNNLFYIDADLVDAESDRNQVIAHVCSESGIWSGEVAESIARKWPNTKREYRNWYRQRIKNDFGNGAVQFINTNTTHVNRLVRIANMIAQSKTGRPIQYRALRRCLMEVGRKAIKIGATVHLPKFDNSQTDSWPDIELIIFNTLCTADVAVYIYQPSKSIDEQWFGGVIEKKNHFRSG